MLAKGEWDLKTASYNFSLNRNAVRLLKEKVIPHAQALDVGVIKLANGSTVLDMGINFPGGWLAGKYFVEVGLGGLGQLSFGKMQLKNYMVPSVRVQVTYPAVAEMAAHVAYWKIRYKGQNVVISGPIRSITGTDIFARAVDYRDTAAGEAVALLQTTELPDEGLADYLAKEAGILPENLYILAAKTATIVGAIQVCARNVEQTLPTLYDRGFPMEYVVQANAVAPVVSVVDDEEIAYGRVNDCLIYGQETNVFVRCSDEEIIRMLKDIPFSKNEDVYGTQFQELFALCNKDWAQVPRDWDAPCKVNFYNLVTGNTFSTGKIGYEVLEKSFLGN